MKMTAAVLVQCGQPLQLLELEVPKLQRGQVLVKIAYSAICRSQLMEINGLRGRDKWLPHLLGHEASGVVVDVGAGVTKVARGDEVVITWIKSYGIESEPPKYSHKGRTINAGPATTFSNYSIVAENRVALKPYNIDMDAAVLFGCALATGSGMVLNELKPSQSDFILVIGLGGVGMAALLALAASGVKNIVAVDRDPAKCDVARAYGATTVVFKDKKELIDLIQTRFPSGADYCIEAGGSTESIELGFSLIKPRSGKLLFASHPPAGKKIALDPHELISGKKIQGSWGGSFNPDVDAARVANLLDHSGISLSNFIQDRFPLSEINTAVDLFAAEKIFRPILVMDSKDGAAKP